MIAEFIAVAVAILFTIATSVPAWPLHGTGVHRRGYLARSAGGIILPFVGIKLIDVLIVALKLA